ncbi:hypothetical protein EV191_109114 [Tamaricihabitans halophyticus]|uniref:Magnesium transporter NIPA n=1 Tax=Tamaricihabitans halophyticus TaxID=1262583 RepID=A0A4R2QIU9_9PSEU|nr:DMT family transporter [Tamaricihabitans halophyticus]TCP49292.1 hypothetical protein EV191_109114 [Tamaricihabitans halophyticus]
MMLLAIACAVLGAVCSAVGARLQYTAVRTETEGSELGLRGLPKLIKNRSWRLGFLVLASCAVLQILALAMAPVSVVSPLVVLALPLVAVLHARARGSGLGVVAAGAIVASTLAVAVFVVLAAGAADTHAIARADVFLLSQLVLVGVLGLGLVGALHSGLARCVALAVGAGGAYGLVSIQVRDVAYAVQQRGFEDFPLTSALGLVIVFLAGSWFIQLAYASGPPDVVVACQTVLNPIVATGLSAWALGEIAGAGRATVSALVVAGAIAVTGVVLLAKYHPEAVHRAESAKRVRAGALRRRMSGHSRRG